MPVAFGVGILSVDRSSSNKGNGWLCKVVCRLVTMGYEEKLPSLKMGPFFGVTSQLLPRHPSISANSSLPNYSEDILLACWIKKKAISTWDVVKLINSINHCCII